MPQTNRRLLCRVVLKESDSVIPLPRRALTGPLHVSPAGLRINPESSAKVKRRERKTDPLTLSSSSNLKFISLAALWPHVGTKRAQCSKENGPGTVRVRLPPHSFVSGCCPFRVVTLFAQSSFSACAPFIMQRLYFQS